MTNLREINELRKAQSNVRKLTQEAYLELAKVTDSEDSVFSLNGLGIIANRAIGKALKLLSPNVAEIKALEQKFIHEPSTELAKILLSNARELLHKKMNSDAVRILTTLAKRKIQEAMVLLGTIFMNGIKDRIGKTVFKHPQNALKCLTVADNCGNIVAGYLLGTLFRSFGEYSKAKNIFTKNYQRGCVRSATELIILLQLEAAESSDEKELAILEQKIKNIRTDLAYSSNE